MDKYVTVTKRRPAEGDVASKAKRQRPLTAREHLMHVATTPSTRGHDIWVSAATGHQVSEQGGRSVSYNAARIAKLKCQLRPPDAIVPAAEKAVAARYAAQQDASTTKSSTARDSGHISLFDPDHSSRSVTYPERVSPAKTTRVQGCFQGCVFYLDGYLGPAASDWTLKRDITAQGGELSISLAKKQITHVVLSSCGALAHSKIVKEGKLQRRTVQHVTVDWIHACLKAGKRVPSWQYSIEALQAGTKPVPKLWQNAVDHCDSDAVDTGNQEIDGQRQLDAEEGERLDALDR